MVHLLNSFNGKLAKWRYETFFVCFYNLAPLRDLCEHFLVDVDQIFESGFQDGSLLKEVKAACRWKELWVFIPVFLIRVLAKLESARRWGLVCACCSELRHTTGSKHSRCPLSPRRLKEARQFHESLCNDMARNGRELDLDFCEGVEWICIQVGQTERRGAADLKIKGKYLYNVPILVVEAADPVIAGVCVTQLNAIPIDKLTPLEAYYKNVLMPSLEAFL